MNWTQIIIIFITTLTSFFAGISLNVFSANHNLKVEAWKLRLETVYLPLFLHLDELHYKYGAHDFTDLTDDEQDFIIDTLKLNINLVSSEVMTCYFELRSSIRNQEEFGDIATTNKLYFELGNRLFTDFDKLQKQLKLPTPKVDPKFMTEY
ncbi:hypothetical protein HCA78_11545 [Listeria booriae]|uniref:Uncharacterized protein n=1 Tax=Listeria booriae TaxID=1552123 RepID=A0A842CRF1_9LIST|nr:hypothetical protein [Listeria booriae]MBC2004405.1 hypothetical protein [Listeria booriae]